MLFTKRYERYIFSEIFSSFLGATVVFFFVFFMLQMLRLSDFLIVHQVPLSLVSKIASCLLLSFSHFVFPTAFLSAVLVAFGRLSTDSEITAFKACGISLDQLLGVLASFATLVGGITLLCSFQLSPWGERTLIETLHSIGNRRLVSAIHPMTFNSGFYDLLLYATKVDEESASMEEVFIYDERDNKKPVVVVAKRGQLQPIQSDNPLSSHTLLKLYDGSIHPLPEKQNSAERIGFQEYNLYLKIDVSDVAVPNYPRMASLENVLSTIDRADPMSRLYRDFRTELWKRVALILSPFGFAILGVGLGTVATRAAGSRGFLYTLLVAVIYWFLLISCVSNSVQGKGPAPLLLLIPNAVVLLAGVFFYRRRRA